MCYFTFIFIYMFVFLFLHWSVCTVPLQDTQPEVLPNPTPVKENSFRLLVKVYAEPLVIRICRS